MYTLLTNEAALPIFVHNFNRLFKEWGGSQGVLSREIGVTQSRISYWVHGMSLPTFVNIYNLAQVFGCEISEFYKEVPITKRSAGDCELYKAGCCACGGNENAGAFECVGAECEFYGCLEKK